jgi:hypothetical protein
MAVTVDRSSDAAAADVHGRRGRVPAIPSLAAAHSDVAALVVAGYDSIVVSPM